MRNNSGNKRPDTAGEHRRVALPLAGGASHPTEPQTPPVVGFVSLGCAKNLVDSERMLADIAESGAVITGDESLADTIVVNTCGFLGAAREEALEIISELAERKRRGELARIVVAGCLVQRDGTDLRRAVPEIDALVGVNNRGDVSRAVWGAAAETVARRGAVPPADLFLGDYHPQPWSDQGRLRLTPQHYAYVRISEGCNQKCTFCTIPSIRGPLHCKSPEVLVAECRELIADGARELILIGQDTTSYGQDIGYEPGLAGLLRTLDRDCHGAQWLRLMYVYPTVMTEAIMDAIAEGERIVNYVDIPLQHINDRMLKAMGRRVTRRHQEALLEKLRARIPGVTIRTTFIVGFPGETDAEFDELIGFIRDFQFDAVGGFTYSHEAETPAARIAGSVDEAVKRERYERLMLAQQEVALASAARHIGRTFDVLVDEADDHSGVGRHPGQAPEVDATCLIERGSVSAGDFVAAQCTGQDGYDLLVRPIQRALPVV